jgi:hypothetical protein
MAQRSSDLQAIEAEIDREQNRSLSGDEARPKA